MKKYVFTGAFLLAFAGYAFLQSMNSKNQSSVAIQNLSTQTPFADLSTPAVFTPSSTSSSSTSQTASSSESASSTGSSGKTATSTKTSTQTSNTTPTPPATPAPAPAPAPAGKFKSGIYVGSIADAYFGNVQVQAIIANGKLTDIRFLQYPSDSGHSAQISQEALPMLRSEAIAAQSANVDGISGATETTQGFEQSLQSALDQAA